MHTHIYQNSFVILIIAFILLCVIFYIFQIGYNTEILPNGKINKKFSWKYPLAISLIIWVFWHFYLFPSPEKTDLIASDDVFSTPKSVSTTHLSSKTNKLMDQHINMANWN